MTNIRPVLGTTAHVVAAFAAIQAAPHLIELAKRAVKAVTPEFVTTNAGELQKKMDERLKNMEIDGYVTPVTTFVKGFVPVGPSFNKETKKVVKDALLYVAISAGAVFASNRLAWTSYASYDKAANFVGSYLTGRIDILQIAYNTVRKFV